MCLASAVVMVVAFTALSQTETEVLGNIEFPTSGSPEAQKHFLRGVKLLHSFAFEAAAEAFQPLDRAIDRDPCRRCCGNVRDRRTAL